MSTTENQARLTVNIREGRRTHGGTQFSVRLDAAAIHDRQLLLVSAVADETSIKSLRATLQSDPDNRTDFSIEAPGLRRYRLQQTDARYRCKIVRLIEDSAQWHIVAIAKSAGFMADDSDESLWAELASERWTTPVCRAWIPFIRRRMESRNLFATLARHNCKAALVRCAQEELDSIVSEGLAEGEIALPAGPTPASEGGTGIIAMPPADLNEYMQRHGATLGAQAERAMNPLHIPSIHAPALPALLRKPYQAQAHCATAVAAQLRRDNAALLVAECGTGKTLMAQAAIAAHAAGRAYRALVFCPGQLVNKWEREINDTIHGATVTQIEAWTDLTKMDRRAAPIGATWHIIGRDRAKLGSKWRGACNLKRHKKATGEPVFELATCPHCGGFIVDKEGSPLQANDLEAKRRNCEYVRRPRSEEFKIARGCNQPLWTNTGEIWRTEPAAYIKRRMPGFYDYLIVDEAHEEKSAVSAQANAIGALAAAAKKTLALTGTLVGGQAEHIRPLLFRLCPATVLADGFTWDSDLPFSEKYGRIDTIISEKSGGTSTDNRQSKGSSRTTRKAVRPGIMPALFGKHLLDKAIFLSLSEVAENLPALNETPRAIRMDSEQAEAYKKIEDDLREAIKPMIVRGDRRLLGTMLTALLAYPDYPTDWPTLGYASEGGFVPVTTPPDLGLTRTRPKEQALIDLCRSEADERRQTWIFVQYTDKHPVSARLESLLTAAGLRTTALKASISPAKREEWISKHGPKHDVIISHPKLVETGLDLFDKGGRHNFSTLCFYETGYNLFTLRQASRRSWRIGQKAECRVHYLYYGETMQARAMKLMGEKLAAAQALEGQFSAEGLIALSGEGESVEMALAKSLCANMDSAADRRIWEKVGKCA